MCIPGSHVPVAVGTGAVRTPGTSGTGTRLNMPLVLFDPIVTSTVSGCPCKLHIVCVSHMVLSRSYRMEYRMAGTGTRLYMPLIQFDSIVSSTVSGYP